MQFKSLVKFYIVSLLISFIIFFLVSYSQDNHESWNENYSREYLNAMSDADFKKFVDSHRKISGIGYIEVKGKKLERQIQNPSDTKTLLNVKAAEKLILVMAAIGVLLVGYYLISSLINFFRTNDNTKDLPGINRPDDRQLKDNQNTEKRYLNLLGLKGKVSEENIKNRYRQLMSEYHPDKVQHLGREFQQMAEFKTKEIQEAYDYLKQNYIGD
ncbi:MAG TPA: DnaJ domain-containing protein [Smithella sp.]|nr:DnaJ domain-containing protein [Smithella sp.]